MEDAPADTAVAPVPVENVWQGFYGGLSFSGVGGGINENTFGGPQPELESTSGVGAFVGYNWQRGNAVFGGELAYTSFETPFEGFASSFQNNAIELRARGGYAMNNILFYGFVGYATSELDDAGNVFEQSGASYGIGAEYLIKNRYSVGLELSRRSVSGEDALASGTLGTDVDMVTFRAGYHF
ncbi:outer membrane protein [Shimia biformata]|uniref:outer membrane protein n=1 Tax=Shimia biformata TaxID=1294299 RepID=UPI001EF392B4